MASGAVLSPVHPWIPLAGYALVEVEAAGEVLPSPVLNDPAGTWRAAGLRIAGPVHLHLHRGEDFERVRECYPSALPSWLRGLRPPFAYRALWGSVAPSKVPTDDTVRTFLQRLVSTYGQNPRQMWPVHALEAIVALTDERYARRPGHQRAHLWRIAWALQDVLVHGGDAGRLRHECAQHPDFAGLLQVIRPRCWRSTVSWPTQSWARSAGRWH